jgi:hypothetical protein
MPGAHAGTTAIGLITTPGSVLYSTTCAMIHTAARPIDLFLRCSLSLIHHFPEICEGDPRGVYQAYLMIITTEEGKRALSRVC